MVAATAGGREDSRGRRGIWHGSKSVGRGRGGASARDRGRVHRVGMQGYSQLAGMMSVDSNVDSNVRGGRGRDRAAIARGWIGKRGRWPSWVVPSYGGSVECDFTWNVLWRGDGVERVVVARRCALLCGRCCVGVDGNVCRERSGAGASVRQKRGFPVPGWVDTSTVGRAWRRAGTGEVVPGFLFAECVRRRT